MKTQEFRALISLLYDLDPWPHDAGDGDCQINMLLNREARARGFRSWLDAHSHLNDLGLWVESDSAGGAGG
jgi:hypothetical protein